MFGKAGIILFPWISLSGLGPRGDDVEERVGDWRLLQVVTCVGAAGWRGRNGARDVEMAL